MTNCRENNNLDLISKKVLGKKILHMKKYIKVFLILSLTYMEFKLLLNVVYISRTFKPASISSTSFVFLPTTSFHLFPYYHPQRSWGKVIFSQASVILFTRRGMLSQHELQVVSQHALQQVSGGGGIPACPAGFQAQ